MQAFLPGLVVVSTSIIIIAAVAGLYVVRRLFPDAQRRQNNEVAGFFLAVLGVVYAVLLAFIVIAVWERFEAGREVAEHEASQLADVYRLSLAVPDPTGAAIRDLTEQYAHAAIDEEWPAMARGESSPRIRTIGDSLWATATRYEAPTEHDRLIQEQLFHHLSELSDNRRLRELSAQASIPIAMWGLLIGGAAVTIVFTYFFSTPNTLAQYVMTGLYAASIGLVMVLIRLLDPPFSGGIQVTPEAFESVLETIRRTSGG